MEDIQKLGILGAAVGHCASKMGCEYAPKEIYNYLNELKAYWGETVHFKGKSQGLAAVPELAKFSGRLAKAVCTLLEQKKHFLVFGGDHSCAIGTWSGVSNCYPNFGLIWIDAHLDAHTPATSPSGNLHGMPVASLLGYGEPSLKGRLKAENLVLLGVRSYEQAELALLESLGVRIFMMDEIRKKTFEQCFAESLAQFQNIPYGISLDLDALDIGHIAGLGTPEKNGISLEQMCTAFAQMGSQPSLLGVEIAEYNPKLGGNPKQDLAVIQKLVQTLLPNFYS